MGPSIKYVTLFLTNFYPLPLSHSVTHLGPPIFISIESPVKNPLYRISLNGSRGFCSGFCSGFFVWKVLSGVVLSVRPSVRILPFQQKVKHHFQFHVSYV